MREKVGKLRNTVFFQWFGAPEGRKVGSLKRRVRSHLARWEMKNCTPLWREAHFQVKMYKAHHSRTTFRSWDCRCGAKHISKWKCTKHTILGPRLEVEMSKKCTPLWREAHFEVKMYKAHHSWTTFGSWDVQKVHAIVARSTFPSQNVQSTPFSDHFWKLRCRKSARRCGAKHISKWKCTKHTILGPLLEVEMSKKCTPLRREAHFQVKMYKTHRSGPLLVVQMSKKCTPLRREAHFEVKMYKTLGVRTTFGSSDVASLHYTTCYTPLHCTALHYITLHNTTTIHNYTPLHSTTLHYTKSHYTIKHYTTLHSTTLHYTTLHYTTLPSTTLHYITPHYTPIHYNYNYTTTLHYNTLHYTKLHYTTLHYTTLRSTTLHYITLHYTTFRYTSLLSLHYTPLHYNYNYEYTTTLHYSPLH